MKPLCIDLYGGLGGWAEGFLAEGFHVIGFDVERHIYGEHRYPGELVLQDVLTLHGSQFRDAAVIVASPPCQAYSYRAMPWKRAKALPPPDNSLFDACFRIQREACCAAADRHVPLIVEKVAEEGPVFRHKFLGDLSVVAARGLGLEDTFYEQKEEDGKKQPPSLKEIHEDFSVTGKRNVTEFSLAPNGFPNDKVGATATELEFEVYTKAGKEKDDPVDARIRITLISTDPFRTIEGYAKKIGTGDATLKVKLAADQQMKLGEGVEDEPEDEEPEDGPALASAREAGVPTRRR